jgi:alpha-glucosidase (family GH31 glycosyl hydrolase)
MKINNETFIGEVWPNDAAYPDFFHPDTSTWWKSYLTSFHKTV